MKLLSQTVLPVFIDTLNYVGLYFNPCKSSIKVISKLMQQQIDNNDGELTDNERELLTEVDRLTQRLRLVESVTKGIIQKTCALVGFATKLEEPTLDAADIKEAKEVLVDLLVGFEDSKIAHGGKAREILAVCYNAFEHPRYRAVVENVVREDVGTEEPFKNITLKIK